MDKLLDYIATAVYGIIQGLTEVLPVSSSGHLSIANAVLPLQEADLLVATFLHGGSLVAIVWWFRHDIRLVWRRFRDSIKVFHGRFRRLGENKPELTAYQKMPYFMGLSLLPTAVIGLLLRVPAENVFGGRLGASAFLLLNGLFLVTTAWRTRSRRTMDELGWRDYLLIGAMQGIAVIPGISRLGITLCTGLWRGLGWYDSLRLSFLLSIPAIVGGLIVQTSGISAEFSTLLTPDVLLGAGLSLLFSLLGIKFLSGTLLEKKSLFSLGTYCCMLGAFSFLYLVFKY